MTLLAAQPKEGRVAYGFIQGNLGLKRHGSGGNLTIHLRKLEEARLRRHVKGVHRRKTRTWVTVTPPQARCKRWPLILTKALLWRSRRPDVG